MPGDPARLRTLAARWQPPVAPDVAHELLSPALVIDADAVEHNVRTVVAALGATRWRPHVKTTKMPWVVGRLLAQGVRAYKCATSRELAMLLDAGAPDVLFALCARGANARAVADVVRARRAASPAVVAVLVEGEEDLDDWAGVPVSVFVDVDSGLGRTGVPVQDSGTIVALAHAIERRGLRFAGLHAYEGFPAATDDAARRRIVTDGLDGLARALDALDGAGVAAGEVVTTGSLTVPWTIDHAGLAGAAATHRLSPGTVVFHDVHTELRSPWRLPLRPAAAVLTRVISSARSGQITCDAGHKSVAADMGDPVGLIAGRPELSLRSPSEEHLPLAVAPGSPAPRRGDVLTVIPMHVCPTVNLHEAAVLVRDGAVEQVLDVSARAHAVPAG